MFVVDHAADGPEPGRITGARRPARAAARVSRTQVPGGVLGGPAARAGPTHAAPAPAA
ncbi:hypothetical protein [Streptomyces sp. NPDC056061]|uniref:hypothetical protein n=1 Tax=Streptomyces sp. NPDC056061 TaxID=3345700 RepID=UPI0035D7F323